VARRADAAERAAHARLRPLALALPESAETVTFGHPTFQVRGKTFAVLETYKGVLSLAVKAGHADQRAFLADPRFYLTPYSGKHGWVSLKIDGRLDARLARSLLDHSWRQVAPRALAEGLGSKAAASPKTRAAARARAPGGRRRAGPAT
jgi:predicted DNA-binding protein (MmcQ/YjbR family)